MSHYTTAATYAATIYNGNNGDDEQEEFVCISSYHFSNTNHNNFGEGHYEKPEEKEREGKKEEQFILSLMYVYSS